MEKNNLRKIREERMLSKAELARSAGISPLTIDRVEKGLGCRMDTKRKILKALGLNPSDAKLVFPARDEAAAPAKKGRAEAESKTSGSAERDSDKEGERERKERVQKSEAKAETATADPESK